VRASAGAVDGEIAPAEALDEEEEEEEIDDSKPIVTGPVTGAADGDLQVPGAALRGPIDSIDELEVEEEAPEEDEDEEQGYVLEEEDEEVAEEPAAYGDEEEEAEPYREPEEEF
jgi:hypothetical protein